MTQQVCTAGKQQQTTASGTKTGKREADCGRQLQKANGDKEEANSGKQ
jgi:hypothetical protein